MTNSADFRIAVFPGDGIGDEITQPTLRLIAKAAARTGGFTITPQHCPAGAAHYRDQGTALPKPSIDTARQADAILLAAMGLPSVRYDDGTEISPQLDLRFELGLYAGVRPIRAIPGVPVLLADPRTRDMDFVILRESTEGLFASHGKGDITPDRATETMVLTRHTSERLHDFGLNLAARRKASGGPGRATCVDKANVFRAFAWFRDIFDQRAKAFPGLTADHMYVDACALMMVQRPWTLDVLITENMFGDILSDLGAGLIGGMGYAPSADICALGRYRRRARPVPALPRLGPGHRRQGVGQPHRDDPVGRDDAGMARPREAGDRGHPRRRLDPPRRRCRLRRGRAENLRAGRRCRN
jgi:3-isopropylmalate dehydrogenase